MITLKQKYLQHSYSISFVFLASYSHGSFFQKIATYVVINVITMYTKLNL